MVCNFLALVLRILKKGLIVCFLDGVGRQAGGQRWGLEVETKDAVLVTAQLGCVCVCA